MQRVVFQQPSEKRTRDKQNTVQANYEEKDKSPIKPKMAWNEVKKKKEGKETSEI